jgi:hypothetical protein
MKPQEIANQFCSGHTMTELGTALQIVIDALNESEVQFAIVGSLAASEWGVVRSTRDVDLIALVARDHASHIVAALNNHDVYIPVDDALHALAGGGSFNVLHPSTGGKVDIFVVLDTDDFEVMRLQRRVPAEIFGIPSFVVTPEDVVLSKLLWRKESRSDIQWRDCAEIVAALDLDIDHMKRWADRLDIRDDLDNLLAL